MTETTNTTSATKWALRILGLVAFAAIPGASVMLVIWGAWKKWSK